MVSSHGEIAILFAGGFARCRVITGADTGVSRLRLCCSKQHVCSLIKIHPMLLGVDV